MNLFIASFLLLGFVSGTNADERKAVYDLTSGDAGRIEAQKKLRPLIRELHDDYGVRFDMCGGGMKARKIKSESLYSFVHFDKVKPVYLINWQNKGYAYMPVP